MALIVCFGADAGITWDEPVQRHYGELILAWFRSDFSDDRALHFSDLYLYGGLFELLAQRFVEYSWLAPYETRHIITAFVALLGVVGTFRLAALVGGVRAGCCAALVLAFTPLWAGHGLFNSKDIPFATAAVFAAVTAARLGTGPFPCTWRAVLASGLCIGLAVATRPGGWFLVLYPLFAICARWAVEWRRRRERPLAVTWTVLATQLTVRYVVLVALSWLLMLSAWPWAQTSPLLHTFSGIRAAANFPWVGEVLFRGRAISASELPRSYLPVWFAISLPESYLLALLCTPLAVWLWLRRKLKLRAERVVALGTLCLSAFLPLVAALLLRPVIYDAQRHFLFLVPSFAALAGVAIAAVLASKQLPLWLRRGVGAALLGLCLLAGIDMVRLHPYEYVYFNRLSGGLANAFGRYEMDYWGASYKEGLAWVLARAPNPSGRRTLVSGCDPNANYRLAYYLERWPGASQRLGLAPGYAHADVYLAIPRFNCHLVPGKVLHEVSREGVPLLYVIETEHQRASRAETVRAPRR